MTWDARTTRAFLVLATFSLAAAVLNVAWPRLTALAETSMPLEILATALPLLFYVPIYVLFRWSVRRWGWSLDEWSFTLRGRAWSSLAGAVFVLVAVWRPWQWRLGNVSFVQFGSGSFGVGLGVALFEAYARLAEELAYRALAPLLCLRIFAGSPRRTLWAVLLPSAAFALVHTHRPDMIFWLFVSSLLLTAFVLWTRSLAAAFAMHAASTGGSLAVVLALVAWLAIALLNERSRRCRCEVWRLHGTSTSQ
jgi:hypothetical protein